MFYSFKNCKILINSGEVLATDLGIDIQAQLTPYYDVTQRHSTRYVPSQGLGGSCRISYYLTGIDPLRGYTSNETGVISGNFGGLSFNSGYLQSYNINGEPNQPLIANAEIIFFDELKGAFAPNYIRSNEIPILNFSDITIADPVGNNGVIADLTRFSYNFASEISPIYLQGETVPSRIFFGVKQLSVELETDNLAGTLPVSGKTAGITVNLFHPDIPGFTDTLSVSGSLHQRSFKNSAGGILKTTLGIQQNYITNPPSVSSVNVGSAATGSQVVLTVTNGADTSKVLLGDSNADFVINSPTQITVTIPKDAVSGPFYIINSAGQSNASNNFTVNYSPITVNPILPITGTISGAIQVSGSNFYRISNVKFSNVDSNFSVINESLIQVTVPNNAPWGFVTVVSNERSLTGTSPFQFVPIPQIYSFSPATGAMGTRITLTGQGFSGITGVLFNNLPATSFGVVNNNRITGDVPSGYTQGLIKILGQSGVQAFSLTQFSVIAQVTGVIPGSGITGSAVTILGNNFNPTILFESSPNRYLVGFGEGTGEFVRVNNGTLTGLVPPSTTSGTVVLFNPTGGAYPSSISFRLLYPAPIVTSITPPSGKVGDYIVIGGSNFYNVTGVRTSGRGEINNVGNLTVGPAGDVIAGTLAGTSGDFYDVIVDTIGGRGTYGSGVRLLVAPTSSGYLPITGGIGTEITLTGREFYPNTRIYFNWTGAEAIVKSGSITSNYNTIKFYVPFNASGTNTILVDNGVSQISLSPTFTLLRNPFISGFIPVTGTYGTQINLSGSDFNSVTGVYVGNIQATSWQTVSTTGLLFTIPDGANTDYVNLYGVAGNTSSPTQLSVIPQKVTISSIIPTSANEGDTLTIVGTRLNSALLVGFTGNGYTITKDTFSTIGSTGLYISIPSGATDGQVTVTNYGGDTVSAQTLSIRQTPKVLTFSPPFAAYNKEVLISGTNLSGCVIYFAGTNGGLVSGLNQLIVGGTGGKVFVPKEITLGAITVSGNGRIYSSTNDTFIPLPTISGYGPTGIITGGLFSITGFNVSSLQQILGISGLLNYSNVSGAIYNILSGNNWGVDLRNVTGAGIIDPTTGYAIITGRVADNFGYTGRLFLIPSFFTDITGIDSVINHRITSGLSGSWGNPVANIIHSAPSGLGINPKRGLRGTTVVSFSGFNLLTATGILFDDTDTQASPIIFTSNGLAQFIPRTGALSNVDYTRILTKFGNFTLSGINIFTGIEAVSITGFGPSLGSTGSLVLVQGNLRYMTGVNFSARNATFSLPTGSNQLYGTNVTVPDMKSSLPFYAEIIISNEVSEARTGFYTVVESGGFNYGDTSISGNLYVGGYYFQTQSPAIIPTGSGDAVGQRGQIIFDKNYIYYKHFDNIWRRTAMAKF